MKKGYGYGKSFIIISAAIICSLLFIPASSFSKNNQPIKHPYGFFSERRLSQFEKLSVPSDGIVFLGDSLIDEERWKELFPDHKTINRGVLADFTGHVLARIDQIAKGKPCKVFIMIGTNDLKFGIKQAFFVLLGVWRCLIYRKIEPLFN